MSVTQYVAKFEELYRYGHAIAPTEEDKVRKFEWGLGSTRKIVMGMGYTSYAEAVKCALRMEMEDVDFRAKRQGSSSGGPIRTVQNNNDRGPYPAKVNPAQINTQPWKRGDRRQGPSGSNTITQQSDALTVKPLGISAVIDLGQ
ncbi:hypothetical protein Vadar_002638 [Vaccinium darrowii]|uniref:Uncharacterized protein n=1 Tax=Vaccinium darrowii TaxID=229202 RepID=A0ACB7Z190_9ERIC|nr:hypothetical protein Vadar_002638 [Vaccinium darrowii]